MTAIRSILLHADAATRWEGRMRYAASIASAFDADLTTLFAVDSVWAEQPLAMMLSPEAAAIALQMQAPLLHWKEAGFLEPERALALSAWAADLVILAQPDPDRSVKASTPRRLVESVVIDSGCPALVVPYIGAPATTGDTVLVAWKDTRESAQAVKAAIPFLKRARQVILATWPEGDQPSAAAPPMSPPTCDAMAS